MIIDRTIRQEITRTASSGMSPFEAIESCKPLTPTGLELFDAAFELVDDAPKSVKERLFRFLGLAPPPEQVWNVTYRYKVIPPEWPFVQFVTPR